MQYRFLLVFIPQRKAKAQVTQVSTGSPTSESANLPPIWKVNVCLLSTGGHGQLVPRRQRVIAALRVDFHVRALDLNLDLAIAANAGLALIAQRVLVACVSDGLRVSP